MLEKGLVLPHLIHRRASQDPERAYLRDTHGRVLSYRMTHELAMTWASAYRRLGVKAGDTVSVMVPTRLEGMISWLALAWLKGLEVPVHTEFRGRMLARVLNDARSEVLVVSGRYVDRILDIADELTSVRLVVLADGEGDLGDSLPWPTITADEFLDGAEPATGLDGPEYHETARILYTSGTTGVSKGVMVTWYQIHSTASGNLAACALDDTDSYYSPFPLHHLTGQHTAHVMALAGGNVVMREAFKTDAFWSDIAKFGCTTTTLVASMANFLYRQPARGDDESTPLRTVLMVPLITEVDGFKARFGVKIATVYNMTEISTPLTSAGFDLVDARSCGRVRDGYQCRIVNDLDEEVGVGEVGELAVRSDDPWRLMKGYWNLPEESLRTMRNLWLHTGDAFTRDADGNFYFVDRKKDAIRRRGENISSGEVEAEVNEHPSVHESAAVAIASEWDEDDVMVVVVLKPGEELSEAALFEFLSRRMPRFMIPRYIEIVDQLPKTPTQKIQKSILREVGVTDDTWDRVAAGMEPPKAVSR